MIHKTKNNMNRHRRSAQIGALFVHINRKEGAMEKQILTRDWWRCALVRCLKTVCQTAIASIGTAVVLSDVNWLAVVSASILAGILSLLTSLAGLPELEDKAS